MEPDNKKYKTFVRWFSKSSKRSPEELDEFCTENQITRDDIQDWIFSEKFNDDIFDEAINYAKAKTPMIIRSLVDKYEQTKEPILLRHLREFMSLNKKDNEPKGNNYQFNFLNVSDDQYRQILEREARAFNIGSTEESPELLSGDRSEL